MATMHRKASQTWFGLVTHLTRFKQLHSTDRLIRVIATTRVQASETLRYFEHASGKVGRPQLAAQPTSAGMITLGHHAASPSSPH
jgi:hypothetical protein